MRLRVALAPVLLTPLFDSPRDLRWHAASGGEPAWDACAVDAGAGDGSHFSGCNFLAFSLRPVAPPEDGVAGGAASSKSPAAVYVGINPHPHCVTAQLPVAPDGAVWGRAVDTSRPAPEDAVLEGFVGVEEGAYVVNPKALIVLVAR
jgi:hypothetical protein